MKIAILSTEYLHDYLQDAIETIKPDFQAEIFIYYNYVHIVDLYRQLENQFDGFITTGPVPMQTIKKSVENCKPLSFFLCSDSNYYKTLFEVIYQYDDWNLEYGYFDFCDYLCPDQESSLTKYLKNGTLKDWLVQNNEYMEKMSLEDMQESTKRKLEKHIRLWNSGKIKYSLSRMSPIMPDILKAGVNCYYISFSIDDMATCFKELTQEILVNQLRDNQPAAIDVALPLSANSGEDSLKAFQDRYELLEKLIHSYNKKYLYDFIIRETHLGFRISANHRTIELMTKNFTACSLHAFLEKGGIGDVYIGYGLGTDPALAEDRAVNAATESRISSDNGSFLINEAGELTSLFGEGSDISICNQISPYIREISDRSGLSTLTIQKLIAALRIIGTENVTTHELARILHITVRSANRFVTALVKCNLAKVLYSKQTNTKGRPSKVYQFLLELE